LTVFFLRVQRITLVPRVLTHDFGGVFLYINGV